MQSKLPEDFCEIGLFALAQFEAKFPGKLMKERRASCFDIRNIREEMQETGCWSEKERRKCYRLEPTLDFFLASMEENDGDQS